MKQETKKKQEKKPKKQEEEIKGIPLYLAGLILILGILLGAVGAQMFFPQQTEIYNVTVSPEKNTQQKTSNFIVKTISLTSDEFKSLGGEPNTIFKSFEANDIRYEDREVSINSEEGQQLVKKYNVKYLPTTFIETKSLIQFEQVSEGFKKYIDVIRANYTEKEDYFIVPEDNIDNLNHLKLYLKNPVEELDSNICKSSKEGKPKILLFDDPYCVNCIQQSEDQLRTLNKWKDKIDFEYIYAPSISKNLKLTYGFEKTESVIRHYMAADQQGKFLEYRSCVLNSYCDKNLDGEATSNEIATCSYQNNNYGKPIDVNVLSNCVLQVGLDKEKTRIFTGKPAGDKMKKDLELARAFELGKLPEIVVDCKAAHGAINLEILTCNLHPELGC